MTNEQKYKMFKKLLSTLLPKKFPEVDSVEVEDVSEQYSLKDGLFDVLIYVDGTEQEQEDEIKEYINELLDHTGEKFNLRIEYITI
jgi:uncharacterized LabA/DUF88 family protein